MERVKSSHSLNNNNSGSQIINKPDSESLTLLSQEDTDLEVNAELQFFSKIFNILLHWLLLIVREVIPQFIGYKPYFSN